MAGGLPAVGRVGAIPSPSASSAGGNYPPCVNEPSATGRPLAGGRISFGAVRRKPDLNDPLTRLRHKVYWSDRGRLAVLPPGQVFVRDLVAGEFEDDLDAGDATRVEVWRGGRRRGSGSVRQRKPVGAEWSVSDAEDSVNGYLRLGPPASL